MEFTYEPKNGWETVSDMEKSAILDFSEGYKDFLTEGKTERECVTYAIREAEERGFKPLSSYQSLQAGDKVYINNRGKSIMLAVIGEQDITQGIQLVAAHVDSPRLDLKQNPLYEDTDLALFKTHYYGGIKKYQWTTIPLAIHGIVVKKDGESVYITIGEDEKDPVFCVTDLLPHLAAKQMKKNMSEGVSGEALNILAGSRPGEGEKNQVKNAILQILYDQYGICEEDFLSAEIEVVPAGKARDLGFDRSMVGSYGQDDRVCAYTSLMAILETEKPTKTAVTLLADKEEVGSMGNTGMQSKFFEDSLAIICSKLKDNYSDITLRETLGNSQCLSADVGAANDPTYKEVQEALNAPKLNYGVLLTKYTGSRGKGGSNDASAEFMGAVRKLCNDNQIVWQIGELGKVDEGGGGTVAQFIANLNVETIDCGVPVLSMHAPFEVVGKMDVYMAYKTYKHFMK